VLVLADKSYHRLPLPARCLSLPCSSPNAGGWLLAWRLRPCCDQHDGDIDRQLRGVKLGQHQRIWQCQTTYTAEEVSILQHTDVTCRM
jgi:hypothetical protein